MTSPETLLGHLLRWAETRPRAPFLQVTESGVELDYSQVAGLVSGCARVLREEGVRPGDRVYLALENDWTWVVGLLAAEAVGAVAVAGNTRLSPPETARMLEDCRPAVVLADRWQAGKVPADRGFRTILAAGIEPAPDDLTPGEARAPALLAYSSGTSGAPKGVLLAAGSVAASSATYATLFDSSPRTRTAVAVPLFHNTGFVDALGHVLVAGGSVELMRRFDAAAVAAGLVSGRLTYFIGVPAMLQRIADLGLEAAPESTMPWIAYGGAPMSRTTAESFLALLPGARMTNCYGLSEATSITHRMPPELSPGRWDAIGVAVPGTRDRVVDGELFVDSPTRMLGYWDAAGSAAPVDLVDSVWMSTGDMAVQDDDGVYRVLGRKDGLINRGGEKVAPREVETVLCGYPDVVEAVVIGVPDRVLGAVPAAQVVLAKGDRLDERALRAYLGERLADYKIPVWVEAVEELPRNASGKVHLDRVRTVLSRQYGAGP